MNKKLLIKTAIIFIIIGTILILVFSVYSSSLYSNLENETQTSLVEFAQQSANAIRNQINGDFQTIKSIAAALDTKDGDLDSLMRMLSKQTEINNFKRMGIITPSGTMYTTDSEHFDIEDREYFKLSLSGKTVLSDIVIDKIDGEQINVYSTPIYSDNEIKAVLFATHRTEIFNKILNVSAFEGKGFVYVMNNQGEIIFKPNSVDDPNKDYPSLFETLEGALAIYNTNIENIKDDLLNVRYGTIKYYKDEFRYISYTPLGIDQNWFVLALVRENIINARLNYVKRATLYLSIIIILTFLALVLYIIVNTNKSRKIIEESKNELKISEQRYRIVTEQSDDIIFEYNIKAKTIFKSQNYNDKFYHSLQDDILNYKDFIHEEDSFKFINLCTKLLKGAEYGKLEIRMLSKSKKFIWCSVQMSTIFDENNKPIKIIGKIVDIDKNKRETQKLIDKSQKDLLTNIYNKITTQNLIKSTIEEDGESMHALIIIDIDNFKGINDTLGHIYGDTVLKDLSSNMKKLFRTSDILGRIGGDEFIVFLKNIEDDSLVKEKAQCICDVFHSTFLGKDGKYKVSGSIGISLYPKDGTTYEELYSNADKALYESKLKGKDRFSIYSDQ